MWPFSRGGATEGVAVVPGVDVREAYRRARAGARLVDVRSGAEFHTGHPRQAVHVSPRQIKRGETGLDRDDELLVICLSGHRSPRAARSLVDHGFSDVTNVRGGLLAWRKAGLPVDK